MKSILSVVAFILATPLAAQTADSCIPSEEGLYTQDCVDHLRASNRRAAFQESKATCEEVGRHLQGTAYQAVHYGSETTGTSCRIYATVEAASALSSMVLNSGLGATNLPEIVSGGNWQGMEVPEYLQFRQRLFSEEIASLPQIAGSGEAIVQLENSFSDQPELSIDLNAIEQFELEATLNGYRLLSDENIRFLIDDQGNVLGLETVMK